MTSATAEREVVENSYHGCIVRSTQEARVTPGSDGWTHEVLYRVNHDLQPGETELWELLADQPFLTLGQAIQAARQFKDRMGIGSQLRLHTPPVAEAASDVETEIDTLDSPVADHSADDGVFHDAT